jgi:O-antigen/teichoic acid export membrane protein
MSLKKRYLGGMLSGAGSVLFKTGLNMAVIPMLIGYLGLDTFGLYVLLLALLESSMMFGLGLTSALTKVLGAMPDNRSQYLRVGHGMFGALALLILLAAMIIWPRFSHIFHIAPELTDTAQASFLLIMLEAGLSVYSTYYQAILLAHCEHQWTNLADTLYYAIANVGALILLMAGFNLPAILAIRLAGAILRLALMMIQSVKIEPAAIRCNAPYRKNILIELSRLSLQGMMINFSVIISHKIDDLVIARFLPLSAVGIYEIVFRFLGTTMQVCLKLSEGAFPLFSRMASENRREDAANLFLRMSGFLNMVAGMMLLLIVFYYRELFVIFSAGRVPLESTIPVLIVAVPCVLSGVLQLSASAWLFAWGHQKFLTVSSLLAALANLALSLIFVQMFGIVGVALGTLIPQLIQHQGSLIRKTCQSLKISAGRYIMTVHGALILPLAVSYGWIQLWKPVLENTPFPLPVIALTGASGALIGSLVWFALSATEMEKNLVAEKCIRPLKTALRTWKPGTAASGEMNEG